MTSNKLSSNDHFYNDIYEELIKKAQESDTGIMYKLLKVNKIKLSIVILITHPDIWKIVGIKCECISLTCILLTCFHGSKSHTAKAFLQDSQ